MFYGGFGTRWKSAKPVVTESALLASLGVFITAGVTGLFCHYVMKWGWLEGLLMGSVISSTDAASVFSILRTRKMGLKNNTAPMIEFESGSNDPCSYMLTAVLLSMLRDNVSFGSIAWTVFAQIAFGIALALLIAKAAKWVLSRHKFPAGFESLFFLAVAIISYAVPSMIGGNGYLSAYIVGIILGNQEFKAKKDLVPFFDGITTLTQIVIFFMLGLIAVPGDLQKAVVPAIIIFLVISLVSRPLAVASILLPFRKYPRKQIGFVSFVGLRGAASIVFAIMTLEYRNLLQNDIFSIVFCIVLISISFQGTLIPHVAKQLDMIDAGNDVMKTFSDYVENNTDMVFSALMIRKDSNWIGRAIKDLRLPSRDILAVLLIRNGQRWIPKGDTEIMEGDKIVFCGYSFSQDFNLDIVEHPLSKGSQWAGKRVMDYPYKNKSMLLLIKRGNEKIVPNGQTVLREGDILIILKD